MIVFNEMQKDIWARTIERAIAAKLCFTGCGWLNDDGVCVSSTGCMYQSKEVNNGKHNTLYTLA